MPQLEPIPSGAVAPNGSHMRRNLILAACAVVCLAVFAADMLGKPHEDAGSSETTHLIMILTWAALGLAYAWMRWRPRKPYDPVTVRPRAEAFQVKRWRLLVVLAAYLGLVLVPLAASEALRLKAADTALDRLFDAVLFLAPCALTVGVMTSGIYSRAWGAVVDDELTASHRARAFALGFGVAAVAGAAGFVTTLFRPDLDPAVLPAVIGFATAAAALRFALLERGGQLTDG